MAIINCPECNNEISSEVRICPHCGFKQFRETSKIVAVFFTIFSTIIFTYCFVHYLDTDLRITFWSILISMICLEIYAYNKRATPEN